MYIDVKVIFHYQNAIILPRIQSSNIPSSLTLRLIGVIWGRIDKGEEKLGGRVV